MPTRVTAKKARQKQPGKTPRMMRQARRQRKPSRPAQAYAPPPSHLANFPHPANRLRSNPSSPAPTIKTHPTTSSSSSHSTHITTQRAPAHTAPTDTVTNRRASKAKLARVARPADKLAAAMEMIDQCQSHSHMRQGQHSSNFDGEVRRRNMQCIVENQTTYSTPSQDDGSKLCQ